MRTPVLLLSLLAASVAFAQAPTGTIAGAVQDPSGARIGGAKVSILSPATGFTRILEANGQGDF